MVYYYLKVPKPFVHVFVVALITVPVLKYVIDKQWIFHYNPVSKVNFNYCLVYNR